MLASRLPLATGWGLFLSLATFWLLWLSINTPLVVGKRATATEIQFTRMIVDSTPAVITPTEPPKPVLVPPVIIGPPGPPIVAPPEPPTTTPGPGTRVVVPPPPGPVGPGSGMDGDPVPLVRFNPDYPVAAARRGIEGWVLVQFSVTATGQVTDVSVVDANPPGVFDEETLEAVRRWRYRPKVEEGTPVERVGLRTRIRFEL